MADGVWIAYRADWSEVVPFGGERAALRHAVANGMGVKLAGFGEEIRSSGAQSAPAPKRTRRTKAQIAADQAAARAADTMAEVNRAKASLARQDAGERPPVTTIDEFGLGMTSAEFEADQRDQAFVDRELNQ